uniref:Proteasome assembly chaperone 3 n=1 Tax=Peronospora matthiolae TaxID=2874970 RepID=A0AAV1UDQ2_9STRA
MTTEATVPAKLHTRTDRKEINGVLTDLAVSIFADRVFIAVTQLGTFGTLVEARQKESISGKLQPDIHVRLGRRDDPLLLVYARQFLEHFGVPVGLPVLAALGLKDRSSTTFEAVLQSMKELFAQSQGAEDDCSA